MSDKFEIAHRKLRKIIEKAEKYQREREERLRITLDPENEYTIESYVYLYQTDPLDYFEKWNPLHTFSYNLHKMSLEGNLPYFLDKSFNTYIYEMDRLLKFGLLYYSNIFLNDLRHDLLQYAYVNEKNSENSYFERNNNLMGYLVIAQKCDNNGIVYAFANSPFLAENIPHDFGCDWNLIDARLVQNKVKKKDLENV